MKKQTKKTRKISEIMDNSDRDLMLARTNNFNCDLCVKNERGVCLEDKPFITGKYNGHCPYYKQKVIITNPNPLQDIPSIANLRRDNFECATTDGSLSIDFLDLKNTLDEFVGSRQISLLEKIVNYATEDLKTRLPSKNNEYADKNNVYHNFIEGAKLCGCEPMQYLYYLMTKHLVSIKDIVDKKEIDKDLITEKCGDIRAYITLLEGYYLFDNKMKKPILNN